MHSSKDMEWRGSSVVASISGHIATLTLNRPQKSNALDERAFAEMPQARRIPCSDMSHHFSGTRRRRMTPKIY